MNIHNNSSVPRVRMNQPIIYLTVAACKAEAGAAIRKNSMRVAKLSILPGRFAGSGVPIPASDSLRLMDEPMVSIGTPFSTSLKMPLRQVFSSYRFVPGKSDSRRNQFLQRDL
jgi:hypothetical protein